MRIILMALGLLLSSPAVFSQEAFSTLEEQMTGKEFTDTGLSKLTDQELAALNQWLRARSVATLENASGPYTDTRGFEIQSMKGMDETTIVSRLVGRFSGWDGETIFKLENGMIWKQAEAGTWYMKPEENPMVTIKAGMFNSWALSVADYNKTVRVKRLQ